MNRARQQGRVVTAANQAGSDVQPAVKTESEPTSSPWPWSEERLHWCRCWWAAGPEECSRLSASAGSRRWTTSWRRRRFLWRGSPVLDFKIRKKRRENEWVEPPQPCHMTINSKYKSGPSAYGHIKTAFAHLPSNYCAETGVSDPLMVFCSLLLT